MTDDPSPDETSGNRSHRDQNARRLRLPKIDFVTLILALLAAVILLFLTAELWLPHIGD